MNPNARKIVAREWLLFLVLIAVGVAGACLVTYNNFGKLRDLYDELLQGQWHGAWEIVLAPYVIWQVIRSIRWAVRVQRH